MNRTANEVTMTLDYRALKSTVGLLAILLDRRVRGEGALRTIFLYPMAISFVVTGVAWRWILSPSFGATTGGTSMFGLSKVPVRRAARMRVHIALRLIHRIAGNAR